MDETITLALLADVPERISDVGAIRWLEWGYDDPSAEEWIDITAREAGRDELPVTWVALDEHGSALGAVALGADDDALTEAERDRRTPWLLGLVVRRDSRRRGIGRRLVAQLEEAARTRGHDRVWVVTGSDAVGFYRACGWEPVQDLVTTQEGLPSTVLTRRLLRPER
jgi:GNAT superfamily N-acetyltransferase